MVIIYYLFVRLAIPGDRYAQHINIIIIGTRHSYYSVIMMAWSRYRFETLRISLSD